MAAGDGGLAEDLVRVMHARSTTSISSTMAGQANGEARKATYYVVDNAEALAKFGPNDEAWCVNGARRVRSSSKLTCLLHRERVVCVMTTGQEWQFKQYKWKEPKELFHHGTLLLQAPPSALTTHAINPRPSSQGRLCTMDHRPSQP